MWNVSNAWAWKNFDIIRDVWKGEIFLYDRVLQRGMAGETPTMKRYMQFKFLETFEPFVLSKMYK